MHAFLSLTTAFTLVSAPTPMAAPLQQPVWLCKPGSTADFCETTALNATVVNPGGATSVEPFERPQQRPVDCFYVYPTVNLLPESTPPTAEDEEETVTLMQAGRLTQHCRMFAPMYRQAPLTSYVIGGLGLPTDFETGYQDVKQAFAHYWNNDNLDPATGKRRGVVFLGHSQGAAVVARLLQEEFDGKPEKSDQLVAAYIMGTDVKVPMDATSGGGNDPGATFQHIPSCERPNPSAPIPTGCVVAFSAYDMPAADADKAALGRTTNLTHRVLCSSPSALLTGARHTDTLPMRAYMPTRQLLRGNILSPSGALTLLFGDYRPTTYPTGYATYPGQVTGRCTWATGTKGRVDWLQVDGLENIKKNHTALGLHVMDFNVDAGGIGDLVAAQAATWTAGQGH
ncbi:DUF3089 domain-containing protein [Sinosporangium siamense]|uniref:Lysophospholipase n=1 Tax=Sinosporangium siamense TaxID=1367973 RepID=A0A919REL1_9ACTN|nr:DUF3089 domain-containing protein [Sinosporangium siamense]GII92458.1 lysophospholipase [Sinosporangium siamense]